MPPKIDISSEFIVAMFVLNRRGKSLFEWNQWKISELSFFIAKWYFVVKIFIIFFIFMLATAGEEIKWERKSGGQEREPFVNWLTQLLVRVKMMNDAKWCDDENCLFPGFPHTPTKKERTKEHKNETQSNSGDNNLEFYLYFAIGQHKIYKNKYKFIHFASHRILL